MVVSRAVHMVSGQWSVSGQWLVRSRDTAFSLSRPCSRITLHTTAVADYIQENVKKRPEKQTDNEMIIFFTNGKNYVQSLN